MRETRILVEWRNSLRKLCKIAFSSRDASLYLFPYAKLGNYYYGSKTMQARQMSLSFDFTEDIFQQHTPKLSIHETGQVHVFMGAEKVGPLCIPPLTTLTGQHIASVSPDAFESLPIFTEKLRVVGAEVDQVIPVADEAVNGRLAVYVNGDRPAFCSKNRGLIFTLRRSTIARPLYFGVNFVGRPQIGVDGQKGVTIVAGWNPLRPKDVNFDFLYIRGE
jgi:hypothetical protein